MEVVTGQPYSYELFSETKQTLADGTQVSHPATSIKVFHDAAGRMRTERPMVISVPARQDDVAIIEIYDVVAGYRYVLDVENKIAYRSAIPRSRDRTGGSPVAPSDIASADFPIDTNFRTVRSSSALLGPVCGLEGGLNPQNPTCSDPGMFSPTPTVTAPGPPSNAPLPLETGGKLLGTRVIEGLKCEGRLVRGRETWVSRELQIVVLSKSSDPRAGERIEQIKNLSRAKPDSSLFQPPPDYKLVDETGPFQMTITLP
jgi:hypothetical protein